jgi:ATP-dependent Lon protease
LSFFANATEPFDFYKGNISRVSGSDKAANHDYHLHLIELHKSGPSHTLAMARFIAFCSGVLNKPVQSKMVILGIMTLGGNIIPVENLAQTLQMAFDSGAKRILLPPLS